MNTLQGAERFPFLKEKSPTKKYENLGVQSSPPNSVNDDFETMNVAKIVPLSLLNNFQTGDPT